jgi:beta-lactamase superfamily II metal-dependent hydrolase
MLFTLEALEARHGDALLLHYGDAGDPRLIVIDGGPARVWTNSLRPRLEQLKARRSPNDPLELRMVMVSHIDDDHINGILGLTDHLLDLEDAGEEFPIDIDTVWHNSFDDIIKKAKAQGTAFEAVAAAAAAADGAVPSLGLDEPAAAIAASVPQGRKLRGNCTSLTLDVNGPFEDLVAAPARGKKTVKMGNGLTFTVLGPNRERLDDLEADWKAKVKKLKAKKKNASAADVEQLAAAFLDDSIYNLSSIVVLASLGGRTMLLTGDARGDDIMKAVRSVKLLKNGRLHVDLLKVPHHGSDRNVSTEFFRVITADHYVISANGEHGNPDVPTLKMLSEARQDDGKPYTVYMTNKLTKVDTFLRGEQNAGRNMQAVYRADNARSVRVDLGDALAD